METLRCIGEKNIIERIQKRFRGISSPHTLIPNGDDAGVFKVQKNSVIVVTADMLTQDVHFLRGINRWEDIGYKAIAVNISDLAAMGDVIPRYALVSLGIEPKTPVTIVDKLFTGMWRICRKLGIELLGGDTVKSTNSIVLSITLIGEGKRENLIKRNGATIGDKLLISGPIGLSGIGLKILLRNRKKDIRELDHEYNYFINAHLRPPIRLAFGRWAGTYKLAHSMIDSSDGLHASLEQLCRSSHIGCRIYLDQIPLSSKVMKWYKGNAYNAYCDAIFSGEDYELVCSLNKNKVNKILSKFKQAYVMGEVTGEKEGIRYFLHGESIRFNNKTFRHF